MKREFHGMKGTTEYNSWESMKKRCYYKKHDSYINYGGVGVKVCDRWKNSFLSFFEDMGKKPNKTYTIDRIDTKGDYTPDNCRWASKTTQSRNRGVQKNNITKVTGVNFYKKTSRYKVHITVDYNTIHLGYYTTIKEAIEVRKNAEIKYWK